MPRQATRAIDDIGALPQEATPRALALARQQRAQRRADKGGEVKKKRMKGKKTHQTQLCSCREENAKEAHARGEPAICL